MKSQNLELDYQELLRDYHCTPSFSFQPRIFTRLQNYIFPFTSSFFLSFLFSFPGVSSFHTKFSFTNDSFPRPPLSHDIQVELVYLLENRFCTNIYICRLEYSKSIFLSTSLAPVCHSLMT